MLPSKVSIIIRANNEEIFIEQILTAIYEQDLPFEHEVNVIDSGSSNKTVDIVKKFDVKFVEIDPVQFSFGRAINMGVELSRADSIEEFFAR